MPQKQVTVVAREELTYKGQLRSPGEVFDVDLVDAILLGRKQRVVRTGKPFEAKPAAATKGKRRSGTYNRRDMVATPPR